MNATDTKVDAESTDRERGKIGIGFSKHSVDRYVDRLRPDLTCPEAREQLRWLVENHGEVRTNAPDWHAGRSRHPADRYLVVGNDYVLPLRGGEGVYVATTFIAHGGLSEKARERRNLRNRDKRHAKRYRRKR